MKILKVLSICLMCLTMTFTFAGCSLPWGSSDTGSGGGSGSGSGNGGGHNIQTGDTTYPTPPDINSAEIEREMAQSYASITQGVRATYLPDVDEVSSDAVLQADREKYLENAAYQYEIVATYILHSLQGEYGEGVSSSSLNYEFYADTSLLPTSDLSEIDISLPAITPSTGVSFRFETNAGAIDAPVNGVQYLGRTPAEVRDSSLAWQMNGATGFVERYKQLVQANLMEIALGHEISSSTSTEQIEEYAKEIEKLGIPQTQEFRDTVYEYIANYIIGADLMARENETLSWVEPYYSWVETIEHEETNEDGSTTTWTEYIYHCVHFNMATGAQPDLLHQNHTDTIFTSSTAYKFGYADTINKILDEILGTFSSDGTQVSTGFTADFPTYTRVEITDVDAYRYFTSYNEELDEDERQVITSMDYREYNSVVIYPKGILEYDEEGNEVVNLEQLLWQFDMLTISIDSVQDITLDIYMRLHIGGEDTIVHLTRMNTDSTLSYDYESETENIDDYLLITEDGIGYKPEFYFLPDKTNTRAMYLPDYLPINSTEIVTGGVTNTTNKTFYQDERAEGDYETELENVYKNTFVGKLGSSVTFENSKNFNQTFTTTNYYGETVDLSDKYLCQDECDFVEFIFDVVEDSSNPADYDYSFKFMIKSLFWDVSTLNEEE